MHTRNELDSIELKRLRDIWMQTFRKKTVAIFWYFLGLSSVSKAGFGKIAFNTKMVMFGLIENSWINSKVFLIDLLVEFWAFYKTKVNTFRASDGQI